MSEIKTRTLMLDVVDAKGNRTNMAVVSLSAEKVSLVSQYADVRDEHGKLLATLTWPSTTVVREV